MVTSGSALLPSLAGVWLLLEVGYWASQQARRWLHRHLTPAELHEVWANCRQGSRKGLHPGTLVNFQHFDTGEGCLHVALRGSHTDLVLLLLHRFPELDCNLPDALGWTPMDLAFPNLGCYAALAFDPRTHLGCRYINTSLNHASVEHLEILLAAMGYRGWQGPCPDMAAEDDGDWPPSPRAQAVLDLAVRFNAEPQKVTSQLLRRLGKPTREGAVLALVIFCCDDLLTLHHLPDP